MVLLRLALLDNLATKNLELTMKNKIKSGCATRALPRFWAACARAINMSALLLMAVSVHAQTQSERFSFSPQVLTAGVANTIRIDDLWGDSCVPRGATVTQTDRTIVINVSVPEGLICAQVLTRYSLTLPPLTLAVPGHYRMLLISSAGQVIEARSQSVQPAVPSAARAFSQFDLNGNWYEPASVGTGLSLSHRRPDADQVFGVWNNYVDSSGATSWFSFQGGSWQSASKYVGEIYQTKSDTRICVPLDPSCPTLALLPARATVVRKIGSYEIEVIDANSMNLTMLQDSLQSTRVVRLQRLN
jgi:hypothetical protein